MSDAIAAFLLALLFPTFIPSLAGMAAYPLLVVVIIVIALVVLLRT